MKRKPLSERIEAAIERVTESGCWIWMKSLRHWGYGQIRVVDRKNKGAKAHRVSYETFVGPIPAGRCVLHRCDVPSCVNPAHLFLGTNADNVADMVAKGRNPRNERSSSAKLTNDQARAIIFSEDPGWRLAKHYGVSQATISQLRNGRTWRGLGMNGVPVWIDGEAALADLGAALADLGYQITTDAAQRLVVQRVPAWLRADAKAQATNVVPMQTSRVKRRS